MRLALAACAILAAAPAAADWRYCLARGPSRTVYLSAPFRVGAEAPGLDEAFAAMLDRTRRPHEPVQCPRAAAAAGLRAMRLTALRYNRQEGETIVELDWSPAGAAGQP